MKQILYSFLITLLIAAPVAPFTSPRRTGTGYPPEVRTFHGTRYAGNSSDYETNTQGTSWFHDLNDDSGLAETNNITLSDGAAIADSFRFKRSVGIHSDSNYSDVQVPVSFNSSVFDHTKVEPEGKDLRFYDTKGEEVPHWIERWNSGGETLIWVRVPRLHPGNNSIRMYYGNPYAEDAGNGTAVFEFFDDFLTFDHNKWTPTNSWFHDLNYLYVYRGSVYSDIKVSGLPGLTCEARIRYNNFGTYSGLCLADEDRTLGNNNGNNSLAYLMNRHGRKTMTSWAATGNVKAYDITAGTTEFTAAEGEFYNMGISLNRTSVSYYRNRQLTNSYQGTWDSPFHIWFGYFTGASAGNADISDLIVDRVLVRKTISTSVTTDLGAELTNPDPYLLSRGIRRPENHSWGVLSVKRSQPPGTSVRVTLLNASDNTSIPGFENLTGEDTRLTNITADGIRLKVVLSGQGRKQPVVHSLGVDWNRNDSWYDGFVGKGRIDHSANVTVEGGRATVGSWKYERRISIRNNGKELTDHQIKVTFNDTEFNYSRAAPSGEDLRFLNGEGNILSHWIEQWNWKGKSTIWVKAKVIPENTSVVRMYYGNPKAKPTASGENTFEFFDDFSGTAIDREKWVVSDWTGLSVSNGKLKITNNNGRVVSRPLFSAPATQEVRFRVVHRAQNGVQPAGFYRWRGNCIGYLSHPSTDYMRVNGGWRGLGGTHIGTGSWHRLTFAAMDEETVNVKVEYPGEGLTTYDRNFSNGVNNERVLLGRRSDDWAPNQPVEAYWDHVFVRKYAAVPPQISVENGRPTGQPFVVSEKIELPDNRLWDSFSAATVEPSGTDITFTILNGDNLTPIPGFGNITKGTTHLNNLTDMGIGSLMLRADLNGTSKSFPSILFWGVNWTEPQAPVLLKNIEDQMIDEESKAPKLVNLSAYFFDHYSHLRPPSYRIVNQSDAENISLNISGGFLGVVDTPVNWSGGTGVVVSCTNKLDLTTRSNRFGITVRNVNDPPISRLTHPEDRDVVPSTTVTLSWNVTDSDTEPDNITYDLYFSDVPQLDVHESGIEGTEFRISSLSPGARYYWKVVPHDGTDPGWCGSGVWNFRVREAVLEPELILLSPEPGQQLNTSDVELIWSLTNSPGSGVNYSVYMGRTADDLSLLRVTNETRLLPEGLVNATTYYWKIVADLPNVTGELESDVRSFSLTGVHMVEAVFSVDSISVDRGNNATAYLTVINKGNVPELIIIEVLGPLKPHVSIPGNVSLGPGGERRMILRIHAHGELEEKSYSLRVLLNYSGRETEARSEVEIAERVQGESGFALTDNPWFILAGAGGLFILLLVIVIVRKRRARERSSEKEGGREEGVEREEKKIGEEKGGESPGEEVRSLYADIGEGDKGAGELSYDLGAGDIEGEVQEGPDTHPSPADTSLSPFTVPSRPASQEPDTSYLPGASGSPFDDLAASPFSASAVSPPVEGGAAFDVTDRKGISSETPSPTDKTKDDEEVAVDGEKPPPSLELTVGDTVLDYILPQTTRGSEEVEEPPEVKIDDEMSYLPPAPPDRLDTGKEKETDTDLVDAIVLEEDGREEAGKTDDKNDDSIGKEAGKTGEMTGSSVGNKTGKTGEMTGSSVGNKTGKGLPDETKND